MSMWVSILRRYLLFIFEYATLTVTIQSTTCKNNPNEHDYIDLLTANNTNK